MLAAADCSVQDTVVALQALAEFASLTVMPSGGEVGLDLTATYGEESHSFATITHSNALLLQTLRVNHALLSSLSSPSTRTTDAKGQLYECVNG